MAYIDKEYYKEIFKGKEIPDDVFGRIAEIASDVIDDVVNKPIDSTVKESAEVKKATAYQAELLYEQGGVNVVTGLVSAFSGGSESLGGYSVSGGNGNYPTKNGIPVSPLAIAQLRKAGLMSRWLFSRASEDGV